MFVNFNILNQLGSPAINSNTFANRPAAGQTGRLFVSTDTFEIYRDNGTSWDLIGGPGTSTITGSGTATQVAYFTGTNAIGSSANLFWDNTNGFLGVGTATPGARIEAVKTDGYGIYSNYTTSAGSGATTTGIYSINNTAGSGYAAVIEEKTGNTTGGQYPLLVKHSLSSGTAAAGMGTGLQFQLPDNAGTFKTTQLTIETTDAAAASYSTRYRFNVQSNGSSTPVAYINATLQDPATATPGAALDIHSTGTIAQLNSTGATNNGYLAFQRAGTTTFSIGDTYNAGTNYFRIFGNSLSADIVRIFAATGESFFTSTETYSSGNSIGISVQNNLTIPNGVNVGLAALGGVNSNLNLTLQGSTTVANTGRQGLEGSTSINFTGAGTLTMTQGSSTVRAFSALSSVYAFNGSAVGTITHLAGLRICFPDNVGSAVNITNNYALLINNQTTGTGTVTYTNRWGIYQEGNSDLNYFNGNLLLGSTTNSGEQLQVTGAAIVTSSITGASFIPTNSSIPVNGMYLPSANAVGISTNSIQRLHISSTGSVGIGNNAPVSLLSLSGAFAKSLSNEDTWHLQIRDNTSMTTGVGGSIVLTANYTTGGAGAAIAGINGYKENSTSGNAAGQLRFYTSNSGGVLQLNALFTSGGNFLIGTTTTTANGGILQLSSGITFPATQVASSNVNTLDDYEEGDFTPVLQGQTTAGSYTYDTDRTNGKYIKIGKKVFIEAVIRVDTVVSAGTGDALIKGLPFQPANIDFSWERIPGVLVVQSGPTLTGSSIFSYTEGSTNTDAIKFGLQGTSTWAAISVTDVDEPFSIWWLSINYEVA